MRISRSMIILALILLAARIAPAAEVSFADCAPEETLLFAEMADRRGLEENWRRTPYARLWADPEFGPFFKPLRDQLGDLTKSLREDRGVTDEELKRLFPGRICVFLSDLRYEADRTSRIVYQERNTGLIAKIAPGSEDRVRRLIEENVLGRLPGNAERSAEEFRGIRIYTSVFLQNAVGKVREDADGGVRRLGPEQPTERGTTESGISVPPENMAEYHYEYAFVDDICFLLEGQRAFMKKTLTNYLAARDGAVSEASLGGSANFRRFRSELDIEPQVLGFVNIERLLQQVAVDPAWQRMMAVRTLSLKELRAAGAAITLGEGAAQARLVLTSSPNPQGVASLLIRNGQGDFGSLRFTPDDAWRWASSPHDFAAIYDMVKRTVFEMNPPAWQMVAGVLDQIKQQTGTDFEKDIVGALGGELASYTRPPASALASLSQPGVTNPSEPRQVVFLGLKRSEGFGPALARFLEAAMGMQSPTQKVRFQTEEFLSSSIYRLVVPESQNPAMAGMRQPSFCFAVANSHLVMSSDVSEVRAVLRQAAGQGGATLSAKSDFRRAMDSLKPGSIERSWVDMARAVENLAKTMQNNPLFLVFFGRFVEPTKMPDPKAFARHFGEMVLGGYASSDAYRVDVRISYPAQ